MFSFIAVQLFLSPKRVQIFIAKEYKFFIAEISTQFYIVIIVIKLKICVTITRKCFNSYCI